jgi:hypothetical protein
MITNTTYVAHLDFIDDGDFDTTMDFLDVAREHHLAAARISNSGPGGWPVYEVIGALPELRKFVAWYFETDDDNVDEFITTKESN